MAIFDGAIFDSVIFDTGVVDNGWLGGGGYAQPYLQYKEKERKKKLSEDIQDTKEAIKQVVVEKETLESKLSKQYSLKGAQLAKLENNVQSLDSEIFRLQEVLRTLEALLFQWDTEDALLVLQLAAPVTIKDANDIAMSIAVYMERIKGK